MKGFKAGLLGAAGAALAATTLHAPARADCPVTGVGSVACIAQLGDYNRASVTQTGSRNHAAVGIVGRGNGQGLIPGRLITTYKNGRAVPGSGQASDTGDDNADDDGNDNGVGHEPYVILVPEMAGGEIVQNGDDNVAVVDVTGDDNKHHVVQQGSFNSAGQFITGDLNTTATRQAGSGNTGLQLAKGASNFAYVAQNGDRNWAIQAQAGDGETRRELLGREGLRGFDGPMSEADKIEAATLAFRVYNELSGGSNNQAFLEQNNDDNTALLVQTGSDNTVALAQHGGAFARIIQDGSGLNVQLNQLPGTNGTTPITIVQSRP